MKKRTYSQSTRVNFSVHCCLVGLLLSLAIVFSYLFLPLATSASVASGPSTGKAATPGQPLSQPQAAPMVAGPGRLIFGVGGVLNGLLMTNTDGTHAVNLTDSGAAQIQHPSVSAQTGMIAFDAQNIQITPPLPAQDRRIFVMNPDGSGVRQITFVPNQANPLLTQDFNPEISPDGTKVAFISARTAGQIHHCTNVNLNVTTQNEVFVVNVDGTNLQQVTQPQYMDDVNNGCEVTNNYAVAWSSDSQQLAVLGKRRYTFAKINLGLSHMYDAISVNGAPIGFNIPDPNDKEPVTKVRLGAGPGFIDWGAGSNILFRADLGSDNTASIGFVSPGGGSVSYTNAQSLVGVVGFGGSTDGKPHGGQIFVEPGSVRYSPDGSKLVIAGVSPLANNNLQPTVFVGTGSGLIPASQNSGWLHSGLAWAPGPAIPTPNQLVLTPNPLVLYSQKTVPVIPTVLDAQGNVIVRAAVWHAGTAGFRCDTAPNQVNCSGSSLGAPDIDFTGKVTWKNREIVGNLCGENGLLRTCMPYFNSQAVPIVTVAASTPTASVHNATPGTFTITRLVNSSGALVINFSLSGTATRNVDYSLSQSGNSITMASGQTSATINVQPTGNSFGSGDKTVIFTLQPDPSNAFYVDTLNNVATVTIKDDGPPPAVLSLSSITPNKGGDGGVVTATVFGTNIKPGATVKLRRSGQPDIPGTSVSVASNGASLTTVFDLTSKAQGAWDVVVTNPDNTTATLSAAFTVEASQGAQVWVDIIGHYTMRSSLVQTFYVAYGNTGDIDAFPTMIQVVIPTDISLADVPQLSDGTEPSVLPQKDGETILDFFVPGIPAKSANGISMKVKSTDALAHTDVKLNVYSLSSDSLDQEANPTVDPSTTITPTVTLNTSNHVTMNVHSANSAGSDDDVVDISISDATAPQEPQVTVVQTANSIEYSITATVPKSSASKSALLNSSMARGSNLNPEFDFWELIHLGHKAHKVHEAWEVAEQIKATKQQQTLEAKLTACLPSTADKTTLKNLSDGTLYVEYAVLVSKLAQAAGAPITPDVDKQLELLLEVIKPAWTRAAVDSIAQDIKDHIATNDQIYLNQNYPPETDGFKIQEYVPYNLPYGTNYFTRTSTILPVFRWLLRHCKCKLVVTKKFNIHANEGTEVPPSMPNASCGCNGTCQQVEKTTTVNIVFSSDPNEKIGPQGAGAAHFIDGLDPLNYAVLFENKDTATAPAQTVTITDQLDTTEVDLSTFRFISFGFSSSEVIAPAGLTSYATDVDLRPAKNLITRINAQLDKNSGLLTCRFSSIDPATGQPTTDPLAGFLPPDKNAPEGQGSVTFSVMPKTGLVTGTEIRNQARIVFDNNAPIDTPQWLNTIDNSLPASHVVPLSSNQNSIVFNVSWAGQDTGAGIQGYDVYVSENGGSFTPWLSDTSDTSAMFIGLPGKTYGFYSIAHDGAGNLEATKTVGETLTGTPSSIVNSIDDPRYFVWRHYRDFLSRQPDQSGWDFWTNQITQCGNDTQCTEVKRINVSAAFFLSIEFQETGYFAYLTYKESYGNPPGAPVPVRLNELLADAQEIGNGVVVGQTGWEQVLESNKQAYMLDFVQRLRFNSAYPTAISPAQFVDTLFLNAGVTPSASDRTDAINEFGVATTTADSAARARVLRRVTDNAAFRQQEFNKAFVLMQYYGYLRRNPNDAPEPSLDYQGYNFWLTKLNQFGGNFVNAEMVKAFIVSGEYRQRFGP